VLAQAQLRLLWLARFNRIHDRFMIAYDVTHFAGTGSVGVL
jgi:hypothetical protein